MLSVFGLECFMGFFFIVLEFCQIRFECCQIVQIVCWGEQVDMWQCSCYVIGYRFVVFLVDQGIELDDVFVMVVQLCYFYVEGFWFVGVVFV